MEGGFGVDCLRHSENLRRKLAGGKLLPTAQLEPRKPAVEVARFLSAHCTT